VKKISLLIGILIGIVSIVGVGHKLDCRWAKPSMTDLDVVAGDVRGMKIQNTVELIDQIERKHKGIPEYNWSEYDLDRYKRLKRYLECLESGKKDCGWYR
jgi:hypothetical protein